MGPGERGAQAVGGGGLQSEVDMVGHQAPGPNRDARIRTAFGHQLDIEPIVVIVEKDVLATVATLGDVMRNAGHDGPREPGHGNPLACDEDGLKAFVSPNLIDIEPIVVIVEKDVLATVATLGDVMRNTGHDGPWEPGHDIPVSMRRRWVKSVCVTEFEEGLKAFVSPNLIFGPVLAIGTLVPLSALDRTLSHSAEQWLGVEPRLLLTGSVAALVFAYLARFMTVSLGTIEAGFAKIKPSLEDAASILGLSALARLREVYVRLVGPSLATAGLLVFVDVMKELPATLVLRPFDFDTLAVRVFDLARDERLAEAALPAMVLISVGLVPVIVLSRRVGSAR